ncbi:MAG: DUF4190 domain-containing protein [Flavobacteriaceae bacterium]|jgi:hypothetical protein|nr:DUF4190 domain-containing protein [Flavobacteriaceae bacterium]
MENAYNPPPTPTQPQTPILGILSLILGIFALIVSFIPCFGSVAVFIAIAPIILGIISIVQANKKGGQKGLGIAGLSIGIIALLIGLFWGLILAAIGHADQNARYTIEQQIDMPRDTINEYYDDYNETDSLYNDIPEASDDKK